MKQLITLTGDEAKDFFLKGSSYFNSDLPLYINFEPLLSAVSNELNGKCYPDYRDKKNKVLPENYQDVNYLMLTNKDGKFEWRPLELINPVLYVSIVNLLCEPNNWKLVVERLSQFQGGKVECCSGIVVPDDDQKTKAAQVYNWWARAEQQSLRLSLEYSHILHTDVVNCYGSLYTHSIAWAIHGFLDAKIHKTDKSLLGNHLDSLIRAGRFGQTNGISQGSVLMDFIAELVLGYVDEQINKKLDGESGFKILRYRDDYRIFSNSDETCEEMLKVISEKLLEVGMKLGSTKTNLCRNVVEGSIKPDKLAGIDLHDMGTAQAQTIQKQLLRIHSFGQRFPNSGALRKLISEYQISVFESLNEEPEDLDVLIGITTDIGFTSPSTFPAIAAILSKLISLAQPESKAMLWDKVRKKMSRVPNNGYLEIWLQRVIKPIDSGLPFMSTEKICRIVNSDSVSLWCTDWIDDVNLKNSVDPSIIVIQKPSEICEIVDPSEIELFTQKACFY